MLERHKRLAGGLAILFSMAVSTATAAPPSDSDFDAKTVAVLPMLMAGGTASAGWTELGARLAWDGQARAEHKTTLGGAPARANLDGDGFGFAGKATAEDVHALKYGYMLGLLPARIAADRSADAKESAQHLAEAAHVLEGLSPEVQQHAKAVLDGAARGHIDGNAFTALLNAANQGMGTENPRIHGYMMTGVWAGLAAYATVRGVESDAFIGMAQPLATLLEEDAAFGSSDRQVAKVVRGIAAKLGQARASVRDVLELGNTLLDVKPS